MQLHWVCATVLYWVSSSSFDIWTGKVWSFVGALLHHCGNSKKGLFLQ